MKVILLMLLFFGLLYAEDETKKVVYDLTTKDVAKFEKTILKGITAHKAYFESNLQELEVTIVIHGDAYKFFVKDPKTTIYKDDTKLLANYSELKKRIHSLMDTYEVEFLMCGAAMPRKELQKNQIVEYVKIIPNSTIGLITKQNEGYAYIPAKD